MDPPCRVFRKRAAGPEVFSSIWSVPPFQLKALPNSLSLDWAGSKMALQASGETSLP